MTTRTDILKKSIVTYNQSNALAMKFSNTLEKYIPTKGKYAGQERDKIDWQRRDRLRVFLGELGLPQRLRDERIKDFMKGVPQLKSEDVSTLFNLPDGINSFPKKYEKLLQQSIKSCS